LHIRHARAYQISLRELFGTINPNPEPIWRSVVLSQEDSVTEQASAIRARLKVTLEDQTKWPDDDRALRHWRSAVEHAGIFVFKDTFKQKAISGFSLSDDSFPIIYLNNSTTKTRQIFSLFHELAHVLLRMNGLSKFETDYLEELPRREREIEKFCNSLAAEILIPMGDFEYQAKEISGNVEKVPDAVFKTLAERYGVSREAVLRRFLDWGKVDSSFYRNKAREWSSQQQQSGGGDYYATRSAYLSGSMAKEVFSRYYRRQITKEEASEYLGVNPQNFEKLEDRMLRGIEA
ncbi:MAG: ImmA/IrrE family metallo-endopeptidase, partial [Synergistaceae bacterium]|nr:ImmA/IrrE family metallo-endopeptidase [Synergistaceae bacterium]